MADQRRNTTWLASVVAGVIIGAVESVLAIAFAALVFGGLLVSNLPDGIGLYLGAAALTLAFMAWRSGSRGVVGSVQDAAAAVLGLVAAAAAKKAADLAYNARISGVEDYEHPDIFLTVVAATLVVTVLCGILFVVIGRFRLGGLDPARAVSGRRRVPRRHGMAALQSWDLRRLGGIPEPEHGRRLPRRAVVQLCPRADPPVPPRPLAFGPRVRRDSCSSRSGS